MKAISFILLGVLISITVFSYAFYDSYEKSAEKQIALKPTRQVATAQLPVYLFDIKLEMDKTQITQGEEPEARVIFISFGTAATPVAMTFRIMDTWGNQVRQEADAITVETEKIFTKRFKNFKPKPGKYTLILKTVYGDSVEDKFSQEFEVERKRFLGIF